MVGPLRLQQRRRVAHLPPRRSPRLQVRPAPMALLLVRALGRRTLGLGYGIALADLVLAPFTPSNTARSAGTIFPVVRSIPPLYGSSPTENPRAIGGYQCWTAFATTSVTSSMFLTGMAPNLLAAEMARTIVGLDIDWMTWMVGFLPVGIPLFLLTPLVTYVPIRHPSSTERSSSGAAGELKAMGASRAAKPSWPCWPWPRSRPGSRARSASRRSRSRSSSCRDDPDRRRELGRRPGPQAGLERARVVRHPRRPGRRIAAGRLPDLVRAAKRDGPDRLPVAASAVAIVTVFFAIRYLLPATPRTRRWRRCPRSWPCWRACPACR